MALRLNEQELQYEPSPTGQPWDEVQDKAFNVLLDQGLGIHEAVGRMLACFPVISPPLVDWWRDR